MSGLLDPLADDPAGSCLLTDFDGTLAPIVDDPAAARPLPGAVDVLARLASRLHTVAVVSGRPAGWLHAIVGDAVTLSGLYGLELVSPHTDGRVEVAAGAERWRTVVDMVAEQARLSAPAGVHVEHKGLAITIHVRRAPERAAWVEAFCAEAATRTGLKVHTAKMSIELRPPVAADKGGVVRSLADGCRAVAYLGDDVGDLPAFTALDELAARGITVVKVAVGGPELDEEVAQVADAVLPSPEDCLMLLRALARSLVQGEHEGRVSPRTRIDPALPVDPEG